MFFDFFGETIFRADLCNADVRLGDLLIHEGPALEAQRNAARIYNADKTYFVLNGTSTSNKVVTSALLAPDDLVLFDRNNHKSVHLGALVLSGARPVYLETARNAWASSAASTARRSTKPAFATRSATSRRSAPACRARSGSR